MNNAPLVSIIIPTWNGEKILPETLRSLEAQTFGDFEALIINDGSTDGTARLVEEFSARDPRFILISRPHSGLAPTRNFGVHRARGEFIAFLDHDDVWLPEKLQRQMELFRADPAANFSCTNYFNWDGQRDLSVYYRDNHELPAGDPAKPLILTNIFGMSTVVVRRELLHRTGEFKAEFEGCEDWDMWLRMLAQGLHVCATREPLMRYRRWPGNLSNKKFMMSNGSVRVLESNLQDNRRPELASLYRRSLNIARSRLELVRARQLIDTAPGKLPAALWRVWRLNPGDARWLLRIPLVGWPKFLGGAALARGVHRKLIEKY